MKVWRAVYSQGIRGGDAATAQLPGRGQGLSITAPAHRIKPLGILPTILRIPPIPRIPRKRCQELRLGPYLHTRRGPG